MPRAEVKQPVPMTRFAVAPAVRGVHNSLRTTRRRLPGMRLPMNVGGRRCGIFNVHLNFRVLGEQRSSSGQSFAVQRLFLSHLWGSLLERPVRQCSVAGLSVFCCLSTGCGVPCKSGRALGIHHRASSSSSESASSRSSSALVMTHRSASRCPDEAEADREGGGESPLPKLALGTLVVVFEDWVPVPGEALPGSKRARSPGGADSRELWLRRSRRETGCVAEAFILVC